MHRLSNLHAGARCMLVVSLALAGAPDATAHHSVAAYDRAHLITLTGTVQRFRYMNPHVRIVLHVVDGRDGDRIWELEGGTVNAVARDGVTAQSLQAGQRIRLLVAPRKDGTDAGEWQRLLEIDGRAFKPQK